MPIHRQRLTIILALLLGCALILVGRLVYLQVLLRNDLIEPEGENPEAKERILPRRGAIFDRGGHFLAIDIPEYEVSATPDMIDDKWGTAASLAELLGRPQQEIHKQLTPEEPQSFVILARRVAASVGRAIEALGIEGIRVAYKPKRFYPEGDLAGQVTGFVSEERKGYCGVEGYYDKELRGEEGWRLLGSLPLSGIINLRSFKPPHDGADLVLTLQRVIQDMVEEELERAVLQYEAKGGTIIVQDPKTGAILAMASYPSYDPNEFGYTPPELLTNPAVSDHYEPGSVFKIITVAAGLDAGTISPQSTFYDNGAITVGGRTFRNWDGGTYGQVTVTGALRHSLNVVMVQISTELGQEKFYEYVHRFGFGQETGIDLQGEIAGHVKLPGDSNWYESDLGANAFGQGIAVTPLQMITAVSAVANGGLLMRPYVVEQTIDHDVTTTTQPTIVHQVISPQTARELTKILAEAVQGEAELALVEGHSIAGKTGTAQVPIVGGYDPELTIASFVGYAPADDPQFAVLVKIDEPQTSPWGSEVAAPVFKAVAERLFVLLDIPPDEVRLAER